MEQINNQVNKYFNLIRSFSDASIVMLLDQECFVYCLKMMFNKFMPTINDHFNYDSYENKPSTLYNTVS